MLSSVLVAYFIHQFQYPLNTPYRPDRSLEHIRTVEQRGALTVDVSSAHTGSVPPGTQRVEMLKLLLSADCSDDIPVQSISVQRRGLGANDDIAAVYVMHRNARISESRSISKRDGSVTINLRNLVIPACMAEEVSVHVDFAADAAIAGEHTFKLKALDAGKATVRIEERLGNFTRPSLTTGTPIGQISVEYLRLNERIRYGSRQRLARFTLTADSRDDHELHAITFTNNGSASDDDLQNLFIEFRNRKISTKATALSSDTVRLEFSPPFELQKNQTLQFSLRGDVRASRSRTIQFIIEEASDIEAAPKRGR